MRLPAHLDVKADPRAGAGPKAERRDHADTGFDKIFATLDGTTIQAETPSAASGKAMKPLVAAPTATAEPRRDVPDAVERASVGSAGSFAIAGLSGVAPAASGTPGEAGQGVIKQGAEKRGAVDDAFALGNLVQGLVGVQGPAGVARPDASREADDTLVPTPGSAPASAIRPESSAATMAAVTDIVVSSSIAPAGKGAFARALASREVPSASLVAGQPAATDASAGAAAKDGDADEDRNRSSSDPASASRASAPSPEKYEAFATIARASAPAQEAGQLAALPGAFRAIVDGAVVLAGATADPTTAPDAAHVPTPAPARTMALRLSYGDHGSIDVRLHLVGQALDVRLTVADKHARGVIGRDRDALAGALREQHFELRSLVIQGSDALPPGENNANNPTSSGSPDHSSGGASGPPGDGGGRQPKASSDRRDEPVASGNRDDPGHGRAARSDTLFV